MFFSNNTGTSNGANIINPIQSARLRTAETFSFKYGKVEVNASLPRGDWIWPAIWLLPTHQEYGIWPASGEIDIIESRGNGPEYPGGGCDTVGSTLHWGPFYPDDKYELTHAEKKLEKSDFTQEFHVFGMEWDEDHITTYVLTYVLTHRSSEIHTDTFTHTHTGTLTPLTIRSCLSNSTNRVSGMRVDGTKIRV